jgi:hypothetical protein
MHQFSIVGLIAGLLVAAVTSAGQSEPTPFERLDQAAAAFSADPTQVSALADAVFAVSHFDDVSLRQIPGPARAMLKSRFVAAEEAYWSGQRPGVTEQNIADALNVLATGLSLPEFAQTTQGQVRKLRMQMLSWNPVFLGRGVVHKNPAGGAAPISETMSPLQAFHVALTMIDQKFGNPIYQLTPAEWEARKSAPQTVKSGIYHRGNTPRIAEIQDRFIDARDSLSEAEGLGLLLEALGKLGAV